MSPDPIEQFLISLFALGALIGAIFAAARAMSYLCDLWDEEQRKLKK